MNDKAFQSKEIANICAQHKCLAISSNKPLKVYFVIVFIVFAGSMVMPLYDIISLPSIASLNGVGYATLADRVVNAILFGGMLFYFGILPVSTLCIITDKFIFVRSIMTLFKIKKIPIEDVIRYRYFTMNIVIKRFDGRKLLYRIITNYSKVMFVALNADEVVHALDSIVSEDVLRNNKNFDKKAEAAAERTMLSGALIFIILPILLAAFIVLKFFARG